MWGWGFPVLESTLSSPQEKASYCSYSVCYNAVMGRCIDCFHISRELVTDVNKCVATLASFCGEPERRVTVAGDHPEATLGTLAVWMCNPPPELVEALDSLDLAAVRQVLFPYTGCTVDIGSRYALPGVTSGCPGCDFNPSIRNPAELLRQVIHRISLINTSSDL